MISLFSPDGDTGSRGWTAESPEGGGLEMGCQGAAAGDSGRARGCPPRLTPGQGGDEAGGREGALVVGTWETEQRHFFTYGMFGRPLDYVKNRFYTRFCGKVAFVAYSKL